MFEELLFRKGNGLLDDRYLEKKKKEDDSEEEWVMMDVKSDIDYYFDTDEEMVE